MEEDELDPAFADMESPSMLSDGFSDDELSLGAGFGSTLSDDLGAGFGNSLSDELDDPHSLYEHPSTPPSGDSSLMDALGHDIDDNGGLATPRKRPAGSGAPSPNSNRLSLAFELASAASPGRSSSRDLLRELGIEEDGEGSEEEREDYEWEGEESCEEERLQVNGSRRSSEAQLSDAFALSGGARSGNITPRRLASSASTTLPSSASSSDGLEEDLAREDEIDASALESTTALESSMETTSLFLAHLRQHTTTETDAHALPPSSSDSSAPSDFTDRQPIVESLASSVIKNMYDIAKQREGQVRELVEMERVFARTDPAWQAALAELEELPRDDVEDQVAEDPSSAVHLPTSHNLSSPPLSPSAPSADLPSSNGNSSHPTIAAPLPSPPPPPTSSALAELSSLRAITASLISALAAINEVAQVNQAATGDAGRKLRALRGHLVTVKDDLQGLERSEEFIIEFEAKEERRARNSGKSRAEEAREEMGRAGKALEESWVKAQRMLTVSA